MIKQTSLNKYNPLPLFAFRKMEKKVRFKCSNCNTYLSDNDCFCKVCGAELIKWGVL